MTRARSSAPDSTHGRTPERFRCDDDDYHRWRSTEVTVGTRVLTVASKPGVPGFGDLDPATALLLDHVEVRDGDRVCDLHCGTGVVGTAAALRTAGAVLMTDTSLLAVEAARRTAAANGAANATVSFGRDAVANAATLGRDAVASAANPGRDDTNAALPADVAIVRLPRGRIPTLQLIHDAYLALRPGGRCYIAGANDEGIRPAIRLLEQLFGNAATLAYRGGSRIAVAVRPDAPAQTTGDFDVPWLDPDHFQSFTVHARGVTCDVRSRPGVFSWDRLDQGTQALLDVMDPGDAQQILDLGCGFGVVGATAALLAPAAHVIMTDASLDAVLSTRRTIDANHLAHRCTVIASDVAAALPDRSIDLVLTNPPFHTGKATDLLIAAQFVRDAARVLRPGGRLVLVANRTLPYEPWLRACFRSFDTLVDGRQFKVLSATRGPGTQSYERPIVTGERPGAA